MAENVMSRSAVAPVPWYNPTIPRSRSSWRAILVADILATGLLSLIPLATPAAGNKAVSAEHLPSFNIISIYTGSKMITWLKYGRSCFWQATSFSWSWFKPHVTSWLSSTSYWWWSKYACKTTTLCVIWIMSHQLIKYIILVTACSNTTNDK